MALVTQLIDTNNASSDAILTRPGLEVSDHRVDPIWQVPEGGGSPRVGQGHVVGWTVDDDPPRMGKVLVGVVPRFGVPLAIWGWPETRAEFVRWVWSEDRRSSQWEWKDRREFLIHLDKIVSRWFEDQFGPLEKDSDHDLTRMDAETAALTLWRICREAARDEGMEPCIEVFCHTPEDSLEHEGVSLWRVCWESGPYQWGVSATLNWDFQIGRYTVKMIPSERDTHKPSWYGEPYFSFDVCFVED